MAFNVLQNTVIDFDIQSMCCWYNFITRGSRMTQDSTSQASRHPPPPPPSEPRSKSGPASPTHAPTFPRNTGQASSLLTVTSRISPVCADFCVKWPIFGQTAGGKRSGVCHLPPPPLDSLVSAEIIVKPRGLAPISSSPQPGERVYLLRLPPHRSRL